MKIFISWSGTQSRLMAEALRVWIPMLLHYAQPWVSQSDIEAGEHWTTKIRQELENSDVGIICITRDNANASWLLFESGALSNSTREGRIIPILLDIEPSELTGPLTLYQAKKFRSLDFLDILISINRHSEQPVPDQILKTLFDALTSKFEETIDKIQNSQQHELPNQPQRTPLNMPTKSLRPLKSIVRELTAALLDKFIPGFVLAAAIASIALILTLIFRPMFN